LKQKRSEIQSSSSFIPSSSVQGDVEEDEFQTSGSSSEGGSPRHPRRGRRPHSSINEFRVEISEFEGNLDPDGFLEWMQTIKRIFE